MKRILVPVDFTDESINAIEHAAKLAQALNSSVTLLHVQHKTAEKLSGGTSTAGINQLLDETRDGVTRAFKVSCIYRIADSPGETLTSAIASSSRDHDMVVMGSNGAETVIQKLIGTHTWRVAQQIEIPLMLVPEEASYRSIRHILYAADLSDSGTFSQLMELAGAFEARIHLVHVEDAGYRKHFEKELYAIADNIIREAGTGTEISFAIIYDDDVCRGIKNHMRENSYDLLALNIKQRLPIPALLRYSVTKEITRDALFPVFLFHR